MTRSLASVSGPHSGAISQEPDTKTAPAVRRGQEPATPGTVVPQPLPPNGQGGSTNDACLQQVLLLGGFLLIFYFLVIRPGQKQEKQRKALLAAIKKGDQVATTGGLHGVIAALNDTTVTLRVDKEVKLTFDRSAIGRVVASEPPAEKQ
jgi:preprotein translocase subunit YajC